jgi:2-phospho-L-lactate guanylyltransferase
MRTLAILPVKRFAAAKQRLGAGVAAPARRELAAAMVADVLEALGRVRGLAGLLVVTGEPRAAELARGSGADVVDDPDDAGQSAATQLGIRAALAAGHERVLLVPGDCPALDPDEVGALLAAGNAAAVTVVPDRHGSGTNALLLAPPDAIAPAFGPGSRERHERLAAEAGVAARVVELRSLGLDVDTPDDLRALAAALSPHEPAAPRTRALLDGVLSAAP